jgi:hypothetical protein
VTLFEHYFWRSVTKRSGHGCENFVAGIEHFGDTEISKNEVRMGVFGQVEEVFGFKI